MQTLGRKPTLGEVLDYYTREDFLNFMFETLHRHRIVTVISKEMHWEPDWARDEVKAESVADLQKLIVDKITQALPNLGRDECPPFYPSFHQSVWKWTDGDKSDPEGKQQRIKDCVFEADLPTWRESFRDVGAIIALMDTYGVRYRHKFSGHRSLHMIIPAEILPRRYWGRNSHKLASMLVNWAGGQAHHLPKITRMPYSLNEDTGLVSLPIARGDLPSFRPWQANLHMVAIHLDAWYEKYTLDEVDAMRQFLEVLEKTEPDLANKYFIPDLDKIVTRYHQRVEKLKGEGVVADAWRMLSSAVPLSEPQLQQGLAYTEPDARWLALEAYLLHGVGITETSVPSLLEEDEEYTQVSAMDILLRFEDDILPYLVNIISNLQSYATISAKTAYLLTQSNSLRAKVLDDITTKAQDSNEALIIAACLAGAMTGNWQSASHILQPVHNAENLTPRDQTRIAAMEIMQEMGDWDRKQGARLAQKLANLGPDVTELLLFAAGSPNRRFRRDIINALATLADPRTVDMLIQMLNDTYSRVRRKAIAGLIRIGEPAVDKLIAATASDQVKIRRYAVVCLGNIGKNEKIIARVKPTILQMLEDSEQVVRRQAIRALKEMVTDEDLKRLLLFIREASWENAREATEVLQTLGDAGKEDIIAMALKEHKPAAAYYIATQGDPRGGDVLADLLTSDDEDAQNAAVELLAELHDPRCIPYLAERLESMVHWRTMWYAHQLGEIGTPTAVDILIDALDSESKFTRRGAARGLGIAKDPRGIPHLIRSLTNEDKKMRSDAGEALLTIGESAIDPLQRALDRDTREGKAQRTRIIHILKKMGVETG